MNITKEDRSAMLDAAQLFDRAINDKGTGPAFLPIGLFLGCNKGMILDIYKKYKAEGRLVYFVNYEGKWLLDGKGDLNLIKE